MRHLVALFMILSSLMAIGQAPRAEAIVVQTSSSSALERHSDRSQRVGESSDEAHVCKRTIAGCRVSEALVRVRPQTTIRLGSDRARE